MSKIDLEAREIALQVVFWGPHFAGKTTAIASIYARTSNQPFEPDENREPVADDAQDGPAFVDYLPLQLGDIRGFKTQVGLYGTCEMPFVPFDNLSSIARSADGIVMILDSDPRRQRHNAQSLERLHRACAVEHVDLAQLAVVVACNKRDLPNAVPLDTLRAPLDPSWPVLEMVATRGQGVMEALKEITRGVLTRLRRSG